MVWKSATRKINIGHEFKNNETADLIMITMNDEVVDKFKYLGATLMKDVKSEININIIIVTATSMLFHLITI